MRVVQVTTPTESRDDVVAVLDEGSIDYALTAEANSDETELLQSPIAPDDVDDVLAALEEAGVDSESYTVLLQTEVAETEDADRPSEQVEEGDGRPLARLAGHRRRIDGHRPAGRVGAGRQCRHRNR